MALVDEQAFSAGLASSGVATSGLRFITKASFDKASNGLRKGFRKFADELPAGYQWFPGVHTPPCCIQPCFRLERITTVLTLFLSKLTMGRSVTNLGWFTTNYLMFHW